MVQLLQAVVFCNMWNGKFKNRLHIEYYKIQRKNENEGHYIVPVIYT